MKTIKMKKRLLAIALCVLMALMLLPATASAAAPTEVYVGDTLVSTYTGEGYWIYDTTNTKLLTQTGADSTNYVVRYVAGADSGTLTLNSVTVPNTAFHEASAIYADGDIILELKNTNTVTGPNITSGSSDSCGILIINNGSLTVQGDGNLTATGGDAGSSGFGHNSLGLYVQTGGLTISSGELTAVGMAAFNNSSGVHVHLNIEISGTGKLTGTGGNAASDSFGVRSYSGNIKVTSGGTLVGTGGSAGRHSYGVQIFYPAARDILLLGGYIKAVSGSTTTTGSNVQAVNKQPVFSDAVQPDPYWYLWKESDTTTAPTGDFTPGSATIHYVFDATHKYLEFKSKTPLTGISLSTNDPAVGTPITATVAPAGATASYQWYTNSSATVTEGTPATGTGNNTASYTPIASDVGKYLYVIATGTGNYNKTASAVTSNQVGISPTIDSQPTSKTITEGQIAIFTISVEGIPLPSFRWQISTDGVIWNDVTVGTGITNSVYLTSGSTISDNGNKYRCVVSNSAGSVTSDTVTLTVKASPAIATQPTDQTATAGQSTFFSINATGYPALSYQWQISTDGVTWNDVTTGTGITNFVYQTADTTLSDNGNKYRCVVSNSEGSVTSNEVTLTVTANPPASGNTISGISSGDTYTSGDTVTFTVSGGGMNNQSPNTGDTRWLPTAWETNPSGNFASGYTQSFSTTGMSVGEHTLIVTFTQQSYNGTAWENTLISDNKTVSFTVKEAASPKTGDSANIYLYGAMMLIASGGMILFIKLKNSKYKE